MDGAASSPPKSSCVFASVQHVWTSLSRPPPPQNYPPISSIPRTTAARLDRATPSKPLLVEEQSFLSSSSPHAAPFLADSPPSNTVLYLAYGSNLSAETFLGRRGIRPISSVNVSAPSLRLTFDLPGFAYKEPCFANTAPREIPKPPKLPPGLPNPPPEIPRPEPPPGFSFPPLEKTSGGDNGSVKVKAHGDPKWDKGLIGVVYEVTPEDYATIVKTEGGGASYQDILVPCIPIPTRPPGVPEQPPMPELPRPFLAHTLYAPRIPKKPDDGDDDGDGNDGDGDDDDKTPLDRLKDRWKEMLLQPIRPDPDYAQPSARYLKLITDGAAEHDLPVEYQRWLATLRPYTITSRRQAVGQFLFLAFVAPALLLYLALSKLLADDDGRVPVWFALATETFFHLVWTVYDRGFKPLFGDGERTVEEDDDEGAMRGLRWRRKDGCDEEKAGLMGGST